MDHHKTDQSEVDRQSDRSPYVPDVTVADNLHVYDVTLRDGAQTPGVDFSPSERREIAALLDEFGARYIEAGYPMQEETEQTIAPVVEATSDSNVVGLADANRTEIDAVLECDLSAISVYIAGSKIHRENRRGEDVDEICERAADAVRYATDHGLEVRFAVVDGTRTDLAVLSELATVVAKHGADMFGISDTVGVLTPRTSRAIVSAVRERVDLPVSVHCHDDLGMAVGNAVSAAEAGAAQVHTTVNGIGANAGNTPLSPFATALAIRHNRHVGDLRVLPELSVTVADYSEIDVSQIAPVVGENAFKYAGPPRADGVRTDPAMYEAYPPDIVGRERSIENSVE